MKGRQLTAHDHSSQMKPTKQVLGSGRLMGKEAGKSFRSLEAGDVCNGG